MSMPATPPVASHALQQIAAGAQSDELARFVRDTVFEAAATRSNGIDAIVRRRAAEQGLSRERAQTPLGNVLDALLTCREDPAAAQLVALLTAHALAADPPQGVEAEDDTALKLVWLAAHVGIDVMSVLDAALGPRAGGLWGAVADLISRHDARGAGIEKAEAIVAAASVAASVHDTAIKRRQELATKVRSPLLQRLVAGPSKSALPLAQVQGEALPSPRGPVATVFLAMCGWLALRQLTRYTARALLQYRRPTSLRVTEQGLLVHSRTELFGRRVREREEVLPLSALARLTREVRFPRAGLYAGLLALAVGSYVGISWFVDGVRSWSWSLALAGAAVVALGVLIDFVFVSLLPGTRGRCQLLVVPRRGSPLCVGQIGTEEADAFLRAVR